MEATVAAFQQAFRIAQEASRKVSRAPSEEAVFEACRAYVKAVIPGASLGFWIFDPESEDLHRLDGSSDGLPDRIAAGHPLVDLVASNTSIEGAIAEFVHREKADCTFALPDSVQGFAFHTLFVPPDQRLLLLLTAPSEAGDDYKLERELVLLVSPTIGLRLSQIWEDKRHRLYQELTLLDSLSLSRRATFDTVAAKIAEALNAHGCSLLLARPPECAEPHCVDCDGLRPCTAFPKVQQFGVMGTTGLFRPQDRSGPPPRSNGVLSEEEILALSYEPGEGSLTGVILDGKSVRVDDARDAKRIQDTFGVEKLLPPKSAEYPFEDGLPRPFLGVSVFDSKKNVIGAVRVHAKKNGPAFTYRDQALLEGVSQEVLGRALCQCRESLNLLESKAHLASVIKVTEELHSDEPSPSVLSVVAESVRSILDADAAYVLTRFDDDGGESGFRVVAHAPDSRIPSFFVVRDGLGLVGETYRLRTCRLIPDVTKCRKYHRPRELQNLPFAVQSEACLPILIKGNCAGVLLVMSRIAGRFFPGCLEQPTLKALAAHAALAMSRERDQQEMISQQAELAADIESSYTKRAGKAIAHVLNTSLGAIRGDIEQLRKVLSTKASVSDPLPISEAMEEEILAIESMITELLDADDLEPSRFALVSMNELVDAFCRHWRPLMVRKQGGLNVVSAPGLDQVCADPVYLRLILWNLVHNAIFWAESSVTVEVTDQGDMYQISVADDGPGISPEIMHAVLTGGSVKSTRPSGSGEGLSSVNSLAREHGGQLHFLHHEAEGGGATVAVTLLKDPSRRKA